MPLPISWSRRKFNGVTSGVYTKLHAGFCPAPLLPDLPDRRALFPGRLESNSPPDAESGLRVSLFGTYREKYHNAWNWEALGVQFEHDLQWIRLWRASRQQRRLSPRSIQPHHVPIGSRRRERPRSGSVRRERNARRLHDRASVQSRAPRWFCMGSEGDGKTSIRGGYGIFFEHGTGNEANTGSLEASSPLYSA